MTGGLPRASDPRLDDVERALRALEARVAALEATSLEPHASIDAGDADSTVPGALPRFDLVPALTLVGRALMALGGAYLLRALTEGNIWPSTVGITLAFGYAAAWLAAADRSGRRHPPAAIFNGATAVMIALPLLWESVTRFQTIGPWVASVVLVASTLAPIAVAVRRRLQPLAWIALVGGLTASVALTAATGALLPFAAAAIVLGVTTLWVGYTVDWVWLRWPAALVADLAVLALAAGVSTHALANAPAAILATQLLLVGAYLVSVAMRTLVRGREVNVFEALQSTAALVVGFGGAAFVANATGTGRPLLVGIALAAAIGSYAVAFAFIIRRQGVRVNFFFYTSVAIVLVISGAALGLPEPASWWAALAVAAASLARLPSRQLARRAAAGSEIAAAAEARARTLLAFHAAAYLFAAAMSAGLFAAVARALTGAAVSQSPIAPRLLVVFGAASICWMLRPAAADSAEPPRGSMPHAAIGLLVALAAAAWLAALGLSDKTAPGVAATVRTSTLAVTALALAWIGGRTRLTEATWLVYPLLAAGAVKLVVEDFPQSSAATLFVALAIYGGALIAAPRVLRHSS